jgi:hypothetical protein
MFSHYRKIGKMMYLRDKDNRISGDGKGKGRKTTFPAIRKAFVDKTVHA